jgi:hypothetical protein
LPQGGGLITFNAVSSAEGQAAVRDNGGPLREGNDPNSASRGAPCPDGAQYYSGTYWTLAGDRGTHAACGSGSSSRGWYHSSGAANFGAYQITVSKGSFTGTFNFPWSEPWAPPPAAQTWNGAFSGHVAGDGADAAAGCRVARRGPARAGTSAATCAYTIRFALTVEDPVSFNELVNVRGRLKGTNLTRLRPLGPTSEPSRPTIITLKKPKVANKKKRQSVVAEVVRARYEKKNNGEELLFLHFAVQTSNAPECKHGDAGSLLFTNFGDKDAATVLCKQGVLRFTKGNADGEITFVQDE